METNKLIDRLRELSKIGIVNYKHDTHVLIEAADRIEELDERVAIMLEGNGYSGRDRDIPVRPITKPGLYGFYCPVCGREVNSRYPHYYCPKCGQAILWDGPKENT